MARRFRRSDDVAFQSLVDQVVIVDARTREVHVLNGTGSRIWALLEHEQSAADVARLLAEEYALGDTDRETEIEAFLHELEEKGLTAPPA